jgi:hypothetical protein
MTEVWSMTDARRMIEERFEEADLPIVELTVRQYPEETVFIVLVDESHILDAATLGNELDEVLAARGIDGFVTVRAAPTPAPSKPGGALQRGVHEQRVTELVRLIAARSRASDVQPSLSYVRDAAHNIAIVTQPRHHLIFGRRGAGKTSLMVEARKLIEDDENLSIWINMQTHRFEAANRAFLWIVQGIVQAVEVHYQFHSRQPQVAVWAAQLAERVEGLLARSDTEPEAIAQLIPLTQRMVRRFTDSSGRRVFIFVDDFHYMPRSDQPRLLDMIHGCVRDADSWIKVAAIRHLSRWFQPSPPIGLQTGQDADAIDLDVTLEDPTRAKTFLEQVLQRYATHVRIRSLSNLFSADALNRLVLASGGVPRDYLVLSSGAILKARTRANARTVGVQDVTNAAGEAAQVKVSELEEDFASDEAPSTLAALDALRSFLESTSWTYFRVSFRDKERFGREYDLLTNLLEARLIHMISSSVSDPHKASERYEAFMLDLSQFSGQRLKRFIHVLDFEEGHLVARQTGKKGTSRRGDTARRLVGILRRAPQFELSSLSTDSQEA